MKKAASSLSSISPSQPVAPLSESAPVLKGAFDLIGDAIKFLGLRWKTLVAIQLIPAILGLILSFINDLNQSGARQTEFWPLTILALILLAPTLFFASLAVYSSMIAIMPGNEGKRWQDYYKDGLKVFWGLLGVSILTALVVVGGYFLLIIPGFIFSVWLIFSAWAYLEQGKGSGLINALKTSKRIVKGYFWSIVWRIFLFYLVASMAVFAVFSFLSIINWILTAIINDSVLTNLLYSIFALPIQLVLTPISLIFIYLLYANIKELKEAGIDKKRLSLWAKILIPVVLIFFLLIPTMLAVIAIKALGTAREKASEAKMESEQKIQDIMNQIDLKNLESQPALDESQELPVGVDGNVNADQNIDANLNEVQ